MFSHVEGLGGRARYQFRRLCFYLLVRCTDLAERTTRLVLGPYAYYVPKNVDWGTTSKTHRIEHTALDRLDFNRQLSYCCLTNYPLPILFRFEMN